MLFAGADTQAAIVARLRLAYRVVSVHIVETSRFDAVERTVFLCPYRNTAAGRFARKWLCHDTRDHIDDGYVTYLRRHKDINY